MRHNPAFGIMGHLMAQHGRVGRRIAKRRKGRHLHMVAGGRVVGLPAVVPDDGAGVAEEILGSGDALVAFLNRRHGGVIAIRQAFDLSDVEDRVGFQERDFAVRFFARSIDVGFGETAGEDDHAAGFAFAHSAAEFQRLPERHPG